MRCIKISFVLLLAAISIVAEVNAQARLVLNGAGVVLSNGARLVVENPAPNAISATSGGIKCTGANDQLIWKTGNATGTYIVPFLCRAGLPIPLTFTKSEGTGNGSISLASYATPTWQNSLYLPTGVLHANSLTDSDNSAQTADRFWEVKPTGYTENPELTDLVFSYATADIEAAGNTITEANLQAFQWSATNQNWRGYLGTAELDTDANTVKITQLQAQNQNSYWIMADNAGSLLPVHFISFSATANGTQADLHWATATEESNQYFAVERTRDGQTFEEITRVKGAGTSSYQNTYFVADEKPFPGLSYYRIKQVDLDGKFSYSSLRSVYFGANQAVVSSYPNPAKTYQVLQFLNWPNQTLLVQLSDLQGRRLLSQQVTILEETEKTVRLDFPALQSGTYLLTISGTEKAITQKLVITN